MAGYSFCFFFLRNTYLFPAVGMYVVDRGRYWYLRYFLVNLFFFVTLGSFETRQSVIPIYFLRFKTELFYETAITLF